jgi:dehydrogenase/reductase SDR family member 12
MALASMVDTVLDRSVVLGYGNLGLAVRRRLAGWPADPPRMAGKVVLVTGAGSGIGLAAAVGFARLGAGVRVLARDEERAVDAAQHTVGEAGIDADVRPVSCDISSLADLRRFIAEFAAREPRLDVLVNNAGVMPGQRRYSVDGVELTFATHVLAPWVLTDGLLPLLRAARPARVVNVTSGGLYSARVPADDPQSEHTDYNPKKIHARTKREQLVLTEMWAGRLQGQGIHVHAMHPGWVDTKGVRNGLPLFRAVTRPIVRTPDEGADTVVWLGAAPEAVQTSGLFWHDRRARPTEYPFGAGRDDGAARSQLWDHVAGLAARS